MSVRRLTKRQHLHWLRSASGPPLWVVIGDASGSWRRTPSRLSQAVPRLFACDLEPAPGQRRREEALPPACRRRPRLPADPNTHRQPKSQAFQERSNSVLDHTPLGEAGAALCVPGSKIPVHRTNLRSHSVPRAFLLRRLGSDCAFLEADYPHIDDICVSTADVTRQPQGSPRKRTRESPIASLLSGSHRTTVEVHGNFRVRAIVVRAHRTVVRSGVFDWNDTSCAGLTAECDPPSS